MGDFPMSQSFMNLSIEEQELKKEEWIESYFLQSTVYSMMFEWIYKIAIPQIVIIIAVDDESTPQVFIKERANYVNRVLEIFRNA